MHGYKATFENIRNFRKFPEFFSLDIRTFLWCISLLSLQLCLVVIIGLWRNASKSMLCAMLDIPIASSSRRLVNLESALTNILQIPSITRKISDHDHLGRSLLVTVEQLAVLPRIVLSVAKKTK